MANDSSISAWEIPWTEESGGLLFMKSQESGVTQHLHNNIAQGTLLGFLW